MNTNKQRILIISLLFLVVGSCAAYTAVDLPKRAPAQEDYLLEQSIERGALLYANNCRTCHGNQGEGLVGPALNTGDWKDQDPVVLEENRRILLRTIQCGRAGTQMPGWLDAYGGSLNERQVEQLVNFLTAPIDEDVLDADGDASNIGWVDAVEFAHNLNHDLTGLVSGDTLSSIAAQHDIGIALLAEANGMTVEQADDHLERGSKIDVPANSDHLDGSRYQIRADNDTIAKLAESLFVGPAAIADLNGLSFEIDYDAGTFTLLDDAGNPLTGLLPGQTLALPEGATYRVSAGETIESIAAQHGIGPGDIRALNEVALEEYDDGDELDGNRRLDLDGEVTITLEGGETIEDLAGMYSLSADDIAGANGLTAEAVLEAGQQLTIPADARYVVQEGDTVESIAEAHGLDAGQLAETNDLGPEFSHFMVLDMPEIEEYEVQGQSLNDVAAGYGATSTAAFAETNGIAVDEVLRIGTELTLPDESSGTAPPDAINLGTGCVQFAVPQGIYQVITGEADLGGEPFEGSIAAEDASRFIHTEVALPPETEVSITFDNRDPVNLHNIQFFASDEIGGDLLMGCTSGCSEDSGDAVRTDIARGPIEQTFTFTTPEPGTYAYNCEVHPTTMVGTLTIEEGAEVPGGA